LPEPGRARAGRIVLHIGVEKTGTTTIQTFCARNRDALRAQGVLYPEGLGSNNHVALAAATGRFEHIRHIGPTEGWQHPDDQARFKVEVAAKLEAAASRARGQTILLSSEHLTSRLGDPQVAALAEMLAPLAEVVDVVVYLRRQDDLLLSLYSTYIKSGGTKDRAWLSQVFWLDFDAHLRRWEAAFGADRITVRLYPPEGPLIDDFFAAAGLPVVADGAMPDRLNRSLDARNMLLLKAINARAAAWDSRGYMPERAELVGFLERRSTGAPPSMSLGERQEFLARFAEGNERVRARYFPERTALFDPPPPGETGEQAAGFDDAIDLAVEIWSDRAAQRKPAGRRPLGSLRRRIRALAARVRRRP
jgi:hypothetical protein